MPPRTTQEAELIARVVPERRAEAEALAAHHDTVVSGAPPGVERLATSLFERGLLTADAFEDYMTYRALGDAEPPGDALPPRRFQLVALIARGAMGEVYLGRDPILGRAIAVKRVTPDGQRDPALLRRFMNEARVTAQLDHPGIVPVYSLEADDHAVPAYAMKLVRGETLTRFLEEATKQARERGRPLPSHALRVRLELFVPVLNAIAYAHRRGVLHRDLKPDNIMIGRFGQVLVMDWGIARVLAHDEPPDTNGPTAANAPPPRHEDETQPSLGNDGQLTRVGTVIGTPTYMSPEQALGEELGPASDQFTLGLLLQEIVTLRPVRRSPGGVLMLELAADGYRQPIEGVEAIPRALRRIIAKACAPSPDRRYASVEAFADDLRRFLADEPTEADPDRGLALLTRWIGRHRGLVASLTIGVALAAFAAVMYLDWQGERALSAERAAARRHELALSGLEVLVDAQGKRMTDRLLRYEALLEGIVGGASVALGRPAPPTDVVVYQHRAGRRDPPEPPTVARPSAAYGRAASLHAEYSAAWGTDREALRARVDQVAQVEPLLRAALLRSAGEELAERPFADAEALVLDRGAPLVWAYFSTEDGLGVGVPGTWESYDSPGGPGYDHRRERWYRLARERRGPVWTVAADESKLGLTVSCLEAVRGPRGEVLGVAGVDAWLSRFIDELLEIPTLSSLGAEALLLDPSGAVIVRSSARAATALTHYTPLPYEDDFVREAVLHAPSGRVRAGLARLALWTRLGSTGMTYLVVGPEDAMLAAFAPHDGSP